MDDPSPAHAKAAFAVLIIVVIDPRPFHPEKGYSVFLAIVCDPDLRKEMGVGRQDGDDEFNPVHVTVAASRPTPAHFRFTDPHQD